MTRLTDWASLVCVRTDVNSGWVHCTEGRRQRAEGKSRLSLKDELALTNVEDAGREGAIYRRGCQQKLSPRW